MFIPVPCKRKKLNCKEHLAKICVLCAVSRSLVKFLIKHVEKATF